jgi:hypothetical protein
MNTNDIPVQQDHWLKWETEKYSEMDSALNRIASTEDPALLKLQRQQDLIRRILNEMRTDVLELGFEDQSEEIKFMKNLKPRFACLQVYYGEWLLLETNRPKSKGGLLLNYYIEALHHVDRFFHFHYAIYQYYQLNLSELDDIYFQRGATAESARHLPLTDPAFSTEVSDLFARFLAYERMREQLLHRIQELGNLSILDTWQLPFTGMRLQWTGHVTSLVELIYGLYYTGQLNYGQATLKDITRLMEDVFQVELSKVWRKFTAIRNRKRISPTYLLDQMRAGIMSRVDDDLSFKPIKQRLR